MLVHFKTDAYAGITMFGDIAVRLLRLMGHSGTVPGAIKAEDVPAALERLRDGLSAHGAEPQPAPSLTDEEERQEPPVNLSTRAYPLVQLLEAAAADQCDVMWDDYSAAATLCSGMSSRTGPFSAASSASSRP